jgi:hypothetical protein
MSVFFSRESHIDFFFVHEKLEIQLAHSCKSGSKFARFELVRYFRNGVNCIF